MRWCATVDGSAVGSLAGVVAAGAARLDGMSFGFGFVE